MGMMEMPDTCISRVKKTVSPHQPDCQPTDKNANYATG
jgi:hypothetical protein